MATVFLPERFSLWLLVPLLAACGETGSETVANGVYISCAGSPGGAVDKVPAPLSKWAQVSCTKYGHVIEAADGWLWNRAGSQASMLLSSQIADTLDTTGNKAYWQAIELEKVAGEEADTIINRFEDDVAPFKAPLLVEVWKLRATNNTGITQIAYFLIDDDQPSGYLCDRGCGTGTPIYILKGRRGEP